MLYDIPFVPSSDESVKTMIKLAAVKHGERVVDLGAGDGKLVIALAETGANVTGIEIDKDRYELASRTIWARGLERRARMVHGSFWHQDLSHYDIFVLYGVPSIMERLRDKITNEAKKGCRIVSNNFEFPGWKPVETVDNIHLYIPLSESLGQLHQQGVAERR